MNSVIPPPEGFLSHLAESQGTASDLAPSCFCHEVRKCCHLEVGTPALQALWGGKGCLTAWLFRWCGSQIHFDVTDEQCWQPPIVLHSTVLLFSEQNYLYSPTNSLSVLIPLSPLMTLALNMPGHLKSLELVPNQCKIFKKAFQKIATHTCRELSLGQVLFEVLSTVTSQDTAHGGRREPWTQTAQLPSGVQIQVGGASLCFSSIPNPW